MRKLLRINPLIIAGVGAFLCTLGIVVGVFLLVIPSNQEIAKQKARIAAASEDGNDNSLKAANKQLADAKVKVAQINATWSKLDLRYMPRYNITNRALAWRQIQQEFSLTLGPKIETWMKDQKDVRSGTAISIQAPPASPNALTVDRPLIVPIGGGSISVAGDFRSILKHVAHWNDFDRLVLIDGLKLSGNSPNMSATYSAQIIIFPQGEKAGAPVKQAGGGGGAGATGGFGPAASAGGGAPPAGFFNNMPPGAFGSGGPPATTPAR